MRAKQDYIESVVQANSVEDAADLDFEAASIITLNGTHIISWVFQPGDGKLLLLLPFLIDAYTDEDGKSHINMSRMNHFSDEIYFVLDERTVLSVDNMSEEIFEVYDPATDQWLSTLESEDGDEVVDIEDTNVVKFNSKKTVH